MWKKLTPLEKAMRAALRKHGEISGAPIKWAKPKRGRPPKSARIGSRTKEQLIHRAEYYFSELSRVRDIVDLCRTMLDRWHRNLPIAHMLLKLETMMDKTGSYEDGPGAGRLGRVISQLSDGVESTPGAIQLMEPEKAAGPGQSWESPNRAREAKEAARRAAIEKLDNWKSFDVEDMEKWQLG